ncbi:hypothetical protein [Pseudogemmobacter sonorensis]|uniref:hypothetical protein n=1 Tax=Pseudogemmobacter sonorensis TaxID=2989681 RepID=UPI0036B811FE
MSIFQTVFGALLPNLLDIAGVMVAILLAGLFRTLKARWGIEIEARHREALQSALMTGIAAALSRGLRREDAIEAAILHVAGVGAKDAVEFFQLEGEDLKRLAESKLHGAFPLVGIDLAGGKDWAGISVVEAGLDR